MTTATDSVVIYHYPRICPRSKFYRVLVNGQTASVYQTSGGGFVCFAFTGNVTVEVELEHPVKEVVVRPLSKGVKAEGEGNRFRLELSKPMNLCFDVPGVDPLYIYANPPETDVPNIDTPGVHYFKTGQVYEVGELHIQENETVYIEGGAVVRGCIRATSAKNVTVRGHGVIDGSYYQRGVESTRTMIFEQCENVQIEGVILIEPTVWMVVLGGSRSVVIRNIKELGVTPGSDGIDIVGSQDVLIEGCMLRNGDDCVVVKSIPHRNWGGDVRNVLVRDCAFFNYRGGNAMEVGFELQTEIVEKITFQNCDVLGVHDFGAVFSIHNGDRATVRDVLFEDIRIEHCYDKLIDFRVLHSRWNRDPVRGQIRNIHLKNIQFHQSTFNPGYTVSLIGGYDLEHTVENVLIEDFYINGKKVTSPDELDLHVKNASGIVIR